MFRFYYRVNGRNTCAELNKRVADQFVYVNTRKPNLPEIRASYIEPVDEATHHAHLLCSKRISHPDVAQFEIGKNEPAVL